MIVVFGSINLDVIGHAPTLMRPGETVLGTTLTFAPGGKGANQALAASRAGGEVKMIGCVGQDDFASAALALLSEAEIDLSGVRRMDRHTGTAMIVVDDAGENMITVLPGANNRLNVSALQNCGIGAGDFLLLQLETPLEAGYEAARLARKNGAKVILNLAPFMDFDPSLLEQVDVLVVNETELAGAAAMLGEDGASPRETAQKLARRFSLAVVATLGAKGAVAAEADSLFEVPAIEITPIDTVGAGDTFVGYLAAGLARHGSLEDAITHAVIAAGLACLKPGAQPSIPEADEVDAWVARA